MRYILIILFISLIGTVVSSTLTDHEDKTIPTSTSVSVDDDINRSKISIPTLEISAPIIFLNSINEEDIQDALEKGVVHYSETAIPGEAGNVYIVGHSSDLPWSEGKYKNVFSRLPEMKPREKIEIFYQGNEYIYEVTETKIVEADDLSVLDQPFDQKLLSLQTSYPIGTALKRFIVISKLIE